MLVFVFFFLIIVISYNCYRLRKHLKISYPCKSKIIKKNSPLEVSIINTYYKAIVFTGKTLGNPHPLTVESEGSYWPLQKNEWILYPLLQGAGVNNTWSLRNKYFGLPDFFCHLSKRIISNKIPFFYGEFSVAFFPTGSLLLDLLLLKIAVKKDFWAPIES